MPRQEGHRILDTGTYYGGTIQEFWGPSSSLEAADYARTHHLVNYRIETLSRDQPIEQTAVMSGVAPGGQFWYFDPSRGGFIIESEGTSVTISDDVGREGYQLGQALAKIITPGGTADVGALSFLGMYFAEQKGYRDLRTGNQFVTSFMQGFQDEISPSKRLEGGS
jgi:hypothetical protein